MHDANSPHLTALVAEDEPAMLNLVSRHLKSLGFRVVEASEGDVAWELAQTCRPDLVILDVMMPGMSGWEICKRLKGPAADGAFKQTGVIMLTGIGENLNEMTSPLFAADAWLNKPFDFRDLDARIRETLGRYAKSVPVTNGVDEPTATHDDLDDEDDDDEEDQRITLIPQRAMPAPAQPKKAAAKKAAPKKVAAPKKATAKKAAKKAAPKKAAAKKAAPKKAGGAKKASKKPAKKAGAKKAPKKGAKKRPAARSKKH